MPPSGGLFPAATTRPARTSRTPLMRPEDGAPAARPRAPRPAPRASRCDRYNAALGWSARQLQACYDAAAAEHIDGFACRYAVEVCASTGAQLADADTGWCWGWRCCAKAVQQLVYDYQCFLAG